jgi:hypothetical protein
LDVPRPLLLSAQAKAEGTLLVLPDQEIPVLSGSIFAEIQAVASGLARHYLWSEGSASWFVMTGSPPPVHAIGFRQLGGWNDDHSHFVFELRVEPWVTANSVKQAFQQLQRDAYGHQGQPRRPRAIDLLEFVEDYREQKIGKTWRQMREEGVDFPWTAAAQLWNETYIKHFPYNASNISRDFEIAWNAIVNPPVKPFGIRREVKSEETA